MRVNDTSPIVARNQTYDSHPAITYYLHESARDEHGNLIRDDDGLLVKAAHLLSGPDLDPSGFENLPTYRDVLLNNGFSEATIDAATYANSWALLTADLNFIDISAANPC